MHTIYDALVFNKMRALMGGRVKYMLVGSAPISPKVLTFFRIAICPTFLEGYGMTETCVLLAQTAYNDFTAGHVAPSIL